MMQYWKTKEKTCPVKSLFWHLKVQMIKEKVTPDHLDAYTKHALEMKCLHLRGILEFKINFYL